MNKFLQHIASLLVLTILFLSSTGFVYNKHYCQDQLRNISLYSIPYNCSDLAKENTNDNHPCMKTESENHCNKKGECNKGCCENETSQFRLNLLVPPFEFDHNLITNYSIQKICQIIYDSKLITLEFFSKKGQFNSDPPIIISNTDIPIRIQSFLI
ncbi:MAG: hypothetical protein ABEH43_11485 [Flavobacteriales bacterium]